MLPDDTRPPLAERLAAQGLSLVVDEDDDTIRRIANLAIDDRQERESRARHPSAKG